jgi:hypothetical protein
MEHAQAFCRDCDRRVRAERASTPHLLHLVATIFTAGLWLPFWILCSVKFGGWLCPVCGSSRLLMRSLVRWWLPK